MAEPVRLEPWSEGNLGLIERLLGDPAMTVYLGGPESSAKLADRQARYERDANQFQIVVAPGERVGWVGFWEQTWRHREVYEMGWSVLPEFQGRGIAAAAALQVVEAARAEGRHRFLYAFPSVHNAPSNAVCRKAGFALLGECEFEHPPGSVIRGNEWRIDLRAGATGSE